MDDDLTIAYMAGLEKGKDTAKAEIERLRAQLAETNLELRKANIKLRDRAHPASEPRDTPEALASLGFWPDCGCGECYAIYCLGNALAQLAERDRDAERLFDAGWRTAANWMERDDLIADMDAPMYLADRKDAIDAALGPSSAKAEEPHNAKADFAHEFEVWQDDVMVASASGPRDDALREAMHYAMVYGQDGPVRVFEVTRTAIDAAMALPLPNKLKPVV